MKSAGKFFRMITGAYALTVFVISLLIVVPCYFLCFIFLGKNGIHVAHRVTRYWAIIDYFFFFISVRLSGKENIDPERSYVFVANHQSLLDIPVYALSCNNTFRFLAKEELTKIPVFGFVIKKLYISVNRGDRTDRKRSLMKMQASLEEGVSVFICPEGTRNKGNQPLLEFRDGAFNLAIQSQTALAVLTLIDTGKLLSPSSLLEFRPGTIHGYWDPPIETKGMTTDDLPALKEKVKNIMLAHLQNKK